MSSVNSKNQQVNQAREELERLYRIFGRVVFLVLPRGTKDLKTRGWQRISFADTQKPAYQQRLLGALKGKGNLAVRLGIDVDRKDRVDEFLRLNPVLRDTVQVHGRKGCQFFFRLPPGAPFPTADKPAVVKLKTDDGKDFGEWRFGETAGAYSMVLGQHPDDAAVFWHIEGDVVKVLAFADIKWPLDVRLPWLGEPDDAAQEDGPPLGYIPSDLENRIKAYLAKCPPSIAGKGGDTALFVAAGKICNGFDLNEDQTFEALKRWFNPFCKPQWNDDRLRYKASEVQKIEHDKPRGHFLRREPGYPPWEKRPCFHTYHHFWNNGDRLRGPGTYYHSVSKEKDENGDGTLVDTWICAPLEILAITATREDNEYGWLVEFTSRNERQKRCAIPARWLAGRGDEALGELLSLGLDLVHGKERALVLAYIANSRPEKRFAAALSTGWHDEKTFVLPDEVIGKTAVWYQGRDEQNPYSRAGNFEDWKTQVAAHAKGNPNLIVALCGAFAGPLFHLFNVPGGGLHWFGHTTMGKTSVLEGAQSVWGGPKFRRTWETTAVGLQAVATLHTDTLLVLDEIHMVDPKVLDGAIYALINGAGKSRGNVHAAARPTARWRVLVLSSGEVSSETQLSQSGLTIRAGQTIRMLDIPVEGKHGAFDNLHGFNGGAEFADALREGAAQHCGHAGPLFVRSLIDSRAAGGLDLSATLTKMQEGFKPLNEPQRRVARIFAILALAGELATEWVLLPWEQKQASKACVKIFRRWQKQTLVSAASSPERKILAAIANFIDRFGDDRFSELSTMSEGVRDRAGYWLDEPLESQGSGPVNPKKVFDKAIERPETRRIYLFTTTGLKEATKGHDFEQVRKALKAADAFFKVGQDGPAATARTPHGTERLYHIDPSKLE